ncbi:FadR/GntR family transcriptional regulator, partial [Patulibacter sp. S7RM1-6]
MEIDAAAAVFSPVRAPTTFEETVERLGGAIRTGVLPAGVQLPPERELAEQLRISRSTLRQALTALAESGHLVAQRGRGG